MTETPALDPYVAGISYDDEPLTLDIGTETTLTDDAIAGFIDTPGSLTRASLDSSILLTVRPSGGDDTNLLNTFLSNPGRKRFTGTFTVTGGLSVAQPGDLDLNDATFNSSLTTTTLFDVTAPDVTIEGGTINNPAAWSGANVAWTYAVIRLAAERCTVKGVTMNNVHKAGIGVREVQDFLITENRIYGNYPAVAIPGQGGGYTGVETAHFGITVDPGAQPEGSGGIITDNIITTCVQGIQFGNFGAGAGSGYVVTGNRFYGCHNHGIYSGNGVTAGNYSNNVFHTCQVAIVTTGAGHKVANNTIWTTTTGGNLNMAGLSIREAIDVSVIGNTITGDAVTGAVAIDVTNVSTTTIQRVVVKNNIINLTNSASSALPAIRIGSGAITQVLEDCLVQGNIVKSSGQVAVGLIFLSVKAGFVGIKNRVKDNHIIITASTLGVTLTNQRYSQVIGNVIETQLDAASNTTLIYVQLVGTTDTLVKDNTYVNQSTWGSNVTLHGTREWDAACDRNVLGPNFCRIDLTKAASFTEVVQNNAANASMIGGRVGEWATASSVGGTVNGKFEFRDSQGVVKGYVYTQSA